MSAKNINYDIDARSSLKKGVALAIVERSARAAGTELEIIVRGKPQAALVTKLPFVRGSVKRHS